MDTVRPVCAPVLQSTPSSPPLPLPAGLTDLDGIVLVERIVAPLQSKPCYQVECLASACQLCPPLECQGSAGMSMHRAP